MYDLPLFANPRHMPLDYTFRPFQADIGEGALQFGNTFVVIDTGLGKTGIFLYIANKKLAEGKVLLLANTTALVEQHELTMRTKTRFPDISGISGKHSKKRRHILWKNSRVIVCTPETFVNDMGSGLVKPADFSCICFDEADLGNGDYAYVQIARELLMTRPAPLVIAMTASPGSDERFMRLLHLYNIVNVQIRTPAHPDVQAFLIEKTRKFLFGVLDTDWLERNDELNEMYDECWERFRAHGTARLPRQRVTLKEFRRIAQLAFAQAKSAKENWILASNVGEYYKLGEVETLFQRYSFKATLEYFAHLEGQSERNKASYRVCKDSRMRRLREYCCDMMRSGKENPKLALIESVAKFERARERLIIFCERVNVAQQIVATLTQRTGVTAEVFLGQKHMRQRDRTAVIKRFTNHETKIVVCTSAAERGIDLPIADCVVIYDPGPSPLKSIQREGRLRKDGDIVYLMSMFRYREEYGNSKTIDQEYFMRSMGGIKRMYEMVKRRSEQKTIQLPLL